MNYEIIKFINNSVELEVNVSPEEETVWLSKEQIAQLFGRDRSVVSRHIKHIFDEQELDEKSNVHFLHIANSDKPVPFYNLDVIISVGYRVKSPNGVIFRKWANSVLKDYLIKGYIINEKRTLVTNDNYINLMHRVDSLDNRLQRVESMQDYAIVKDVIFSENQVFDALVFINQLTELAKTQVVLIDPYLNAYTINAFKGINENVRLKIITSKANNHLSQKDIEKFAEQYGPLSVQTDERYHDRYLIIDNKLFYHLGSSINYLGKRFSQITLIKDDDIIKTLRKRLDEQE